MTDTLTPDQKEMVADGWHIPIVFGVSDFDTLHMALTLDYHDASTIRLWDNIKKQMDQRSLLNRVEELLHD